MTADLATVLLIELRRFLRPVTRLTLLRDPRDELRRLLLGSGWVITADVDVAGVVAAIRGLVDTIEELAADPVPDDLADVMARVTTIAGLVDELTALGGQLAGLAPLADVEPSDPAAVAALSEDLLHHLVVRWLQATGRLVTITDLLAITTIVEVDERELPWLRRPAGTQRRFDPARIPTILADPATALLDALAPQRWQDDDEVIATMLLIGRVVEPILRPRSWRQPVRGRRIVGASVAGQFRRATAELLVPMPGSRRTAVLRVDVEGAGADGTLPSGAPGPGVWLVPHGAASTDIHRDEWSVAVDAAVDTDGRSIEISPSGVVADADITVAAELVIRRRLDLVIGVGRTGLTLGELEVSAGTTLGGDGEPELRVAVVATGSRLGLSTRDFGDAIAKVLPLDLEVPFDLGLEWSSLHGLSVAGSASFDLALASELSLAGGTFVVRNLRLAVVLGDDVELLVAADVHFAIEVLQARVEGIGLGVRFGFTGGPVVGLTVAPPDVLALAVDLPAVTGGGFLAIDHGLGRYAGALALKVLGVGVQAITVIDTRPPGDPDGVAVFASLTLTFPGIPLGFGFVLTGLGGIVAINRTCDGEALAAGLRNGVIDTLLFPDDPVGDAAQLIAQIDDYFPLQPGNVVFGPVVEISWGAPTPLITAQLGVLISVPDGTIAVLGSIAAVLPTPQTPLLRLQLDAIGIVDLPAGEVSVMASLYDSRLLETIDLSGDMAMFVRTRGQPYFLLSVGGYHPAFQPPAHVPAAMHDLRRMTASLAIASTVEVTIRSYFALTSNTVQFGASINVEASVEIWPTTYTARGWFEFNVLLQFSPFKLVADMSAGVAIYSGDKELMGVQLSVSLQGPKPWYAVGTASFRFFGIKVNFNLEVGSTAAGEPKPTVALRDEVVAELASPRAWAEAGPVDGAAAGIAFAALDPDDDDVVWVRPDHQLAVRQGVAPLDRDITVVGQGVPAPGHGRLTVTGAGFGDLAAPYELIDDWFAPAQYEQMGRTQKLARASFERMPAGVSFGAATAVVDTALATTASTDYETADDWVPGADPMGAAVRFGSLGEAMRFAAPPAVPLLTVQPTTWTVVSAVDGTLAFPDGVLGGPDAATLSGGLSQSDALAAAASATVADVLVVPATALLSVPPTAP